MKYEHVLSYVTRAIWAIDPEKLDEILSVLTFRARGDRFTAEEIQARIGEPTSIEPTQRGAVAVIPLKGVVANRMGAMDESSGGMSIERFRGMFRQALGNDAVGSIVLDVNTPGGTVMGVPEMAAEILAARGQKRVVAHVNDTAASAGYWLIAGVDEIVAAPSAMLGAIGVFLCRQDLSEALEKEGIKITVVSAGKYKAEALPFRPMSAEELADKQTLVDGFYDQFVKLVAKGRGVTPSAVRNGYGEGRGVTAQVALASGMIDRIGTLDETIARLVGGRSSRSPMRAEADVPVELAEADVVLAGDVVLPQADGDDGRDDADDQARRFRVL